MGSCAISLRETRGRCAKEDIIDRPRQEERFHDCRVSGLLEPRTGADGPQRRLGAHAWLRSCVPPLTGSVGQAKGLGTNGPLPEVWCCRSFGATRAPLVQSLALAQAHA